MEDNAMMTVGVFSLNKIFHGYTPPPNNYHPGHMSIWSLRYSINVVVSMESDAPVRRPTMRASTSPRLTHIAIIHLYVTITGVT